jgi:nitrite reductase (NADH) small subunit
VTRVASIEAVNLGSVERIPVGEGRVFDVGGLRVAIFRTREGVYATQAECPHRQGPLADGLVGGGQVVCPLHTRKWELSTGKPVGHDCGPLATYAVAVSEAGELLLGVREAA